MNTSLARAVASLARAVKGGERKKERKKKERKEEEERKTKRKKEINSVHRHLNCQLDLT